MQLRACRDATEDVEGREIEMERRVAREAVGVVDAVVFQRPGNECGDVVVGDDYALGYAG